MPLFKVAPAAAEFPLLEVRDPFEIGGPFKGESWSDPDEPELAGRLLQLSTLGGDVVEVGLVGSTTPPIAVE